MFLFFSLPPVVLVSIPHTHKIYMTMEYISGGASGYKIDSFPPAVLWRDETGSQILNPLFGSRSLVLNDTLGKKLINLNRYTH